MNKCLTAILLALSATASAQRLQPAPRLVVNITIDQLRTDYIQAFAPLYGPDGFKKLLSEGRVYEAASYDFLPIDRASAVASISSGTTPYYNNIVSSQWLDRATLRPVYCVADSKVGTSPRLLSTSTIGDELKVATGGSALVYALAFSRDAAVLSAGHAADGAVWVDDSRGVLATSAYYPQKTHKWLNAYNAVYSQRASDDRTKNLAVAHAAQACVVEQAMGRDAVTDYLGEEVQSGTLVKDDTYDENTYYYFDITSFMQQELGAFGMYKHNLQLVFNEDTYTKTFRNLTFSDQQGRSPIVLQLIYKVYESY